MTSEPEPKDNDRQDGETPEEGEFEVVFPMRVHRWKMYGTTLVCTSCPDPHGTQLEPGVHMVGVDERGNPILERSW